MKLKKKKILKLDFLFIFRNVNVFLFFHFQVHPLSTTAKNVDTIVITNSTKKYPNNNNNNNNNTNTSSVNSGGTGSVNLSSPESAYSTGYSTDGTSPGASYPPEYYINIRTGTHYFQSNKTKAGTKKISITDTSVLNDTDDKKFHSNMVHNNATTMTKEKKLLYELKNNIPFKVNFFKYNFLI